MNLKLREYVVMPNHFHGILIIGRNQYNEHHSPIITYIENQFGPQRKNLSSIIRGFKSAVTQNARQIKSKFKWQALFHDHIIKNEESFRRISDYIINNPRIWKDDKFYV
jgi:REP-associated tyrosine transposase